jgi:nitroimidazol reductase NimA-like FMN-containing flavoprotein (pyridoxamine 5'-phosphate oxidase superfamily)
MRFKEKIMRRQEREIRNRETITAMLEKATVGRMATVNKKGIPVIKPVNFVYWDGNIYIHSSRKGEKVTDIRRGSPVCFEVDDPIAYVAARGPACRASYYYRSIIAKGKAALVRSRDKKLKILEKTMEKYQPEGGYGGTPEELLMKTAVIEISIQEVTGKENLG